MDVSSNDRQPTQMPQQPVMPSQQQLMGQQSDATNMQQNQLTGQQNSVGDPASLDSTAQTGQPNVGDWQEEVYQKIKAMKEIYLPELNEMYQKIANKLQQVDSLPQQQSSEQLDKLKIFKTMLERIIVFLQVSKSNIVIGFKDKLGSYEKQIMNFINTNRPRKPAPTMQQGQLPPPHMQSVLQQHPTVLGQALQPLQVAIIHQQPIQMPQQLMGHISETSSMFEVWRQQRRLRQLRRPEFRPQRAGPLLRVRAPGIARRRVRRLLPRYRDFHRRLHRVGFMP